MIDATHSNSTIPEKKPSILAKPSSKLRRKSFVAIIPVVISGGLLFHLWLYRGDQGLGIFKPDRLADTATTALTPTGNGDWLSASVGKTSRSPSWHAELHLLAKAGRLNSQSDTEIKLTTPTDAAEAIVPVRAAAKPSTLESDVETIDLDTSMVASLVSGAPIPKQRPGPELEAPAPIPRPSPNLSSNGRGVGMQPQVAAIKTTTAFEAIEGDAPQTQKPPRTFFGLLAYAIGKDDKGGMRDQNSVHGNKGLAVYDIQAGVVHLPNGETLEAHSGIGPMRDNPKYVSQPNKGPTPPAIYQLSLREERFHGVEAIRLTPIEGDERTFGRNGLLAHTYMLGRKGDSNGCVVFKNYDRFLAAYKKGEIHQLIVVPQMDDTHYVAANG